MFIISLYHIDLLPLPHKFQRNTYGQSQINHIKGLRTLGVGNGFPTGGQPLLSHALSCRTAQIVRAFKRFLSALAAVGDTLGIKFRHNAA